jgi:hypothetical protein
MVIRPTTMLFNLFIMLWITNFVDAGVLQGDDHAKSIIQYINLA